MYTIANFIEADVIKSCFSSDGNTNLVFIFDWIIIICLNNLKLTLKHLETIWKRKNYASV